MKQIRRWAVHEYGEPAPIVQEMAAASGLSGSTIRDLLYAAGERAARFLNLGYNPITISSAGVSASDIAGIVRILPGVELEIIPKFLRFYEHDDSWREDFFFIANLSRHGRLLLSERLASGRSSSRDIPSLIGNSIVSEYLLNRRRPLRSYRQRDCLGFSIDGDVDPESILLPDPDGFKQRQMVYDQVNRFNGVIAAATFSIANEVRDPTVRAQLLRIKDSLGEQAPPDMRSRRVPSRATRWQPLFDLSRDILRGFGATYNRLPGSMPGFVVNTWRVWEDIVTMSLQIAYPTVAKAQAPASLGSRQRLPAQKSTSITVTPDVTLQDILVDAKYKTGTDAHASRVSEADVYESIAFAHATGRISWCFCPSILRNRPTRDCHAFRGRVGWECSRDRLTHASDRHLEARDASRLCRWPWSRHRAGRELGAIQLKGRMSVKSSGGPLVSPKACG